MKVSGHNLPDLLTPKPSATNTPKPHPDAAQTARAAAKDPGVAARRKADKEAIKARGG